MRAERYVAYLRVSTLGQGRSGLGVAAQRETVRSFLHGSGGKLVGEYTEIESGRRAARPELEAALAACRLHRAVLIVARLDRLTRSVAFLSQLLEAGVDVRFCDLPQVEGPTGRFLLQAMAAVAELEAGLISARTKAALQAAKARGVKLGGYRGRCGTKADLALGLAARQAKARQRASDLAATVAQAKAEGITSLNGIAAYLNERGLTAPRGGTWQAVQVSAMLQHLEAA